MKYFNPATKHIEGDKLATFIKAKIEKAITFDPQRIKPGLALIRVGENPASIMYIKVKQRECRRFGLNSWEYALPDDAQEENIISLINQLNTNASVNGILLQLPLPPHLNTLKLLDYIDPMKDVDALTGANQAKLWRGELDLVPCTPLACLRLLNTVYDKLDGLRVVILGRSIIVGRPLSVLLMHHNCIVTIVHSHAKNPQDLCRNADVIISAVGKLNLITADWVHSESVVIDVGISRIVENKKSRVVGDVDHDSVRSIVRAITPVPGGVGPMTVACLLENTYKLFRKQREAKGEGYCIYDPGNASFEKYTKPIDLEDDLFVE